MSLLSNLKSILSFINTLFNPPSSVVVVISVATEEVVREHVIELFVKSPLEGALVNMVDGTTAKEKQKLEECLHDLDFPKEVIGKSRIEKLEVEKKNEKPKLE